MHILLGPIWFEIFQITITNGRHNPILSTYDRHNYKVESDLISLFLGVVVKASNIDCRVKPPKWKGLLMV